MSFERDNIPGLRLDRRWKLLLLPGLALQWLTYMLPRGGYASVASSTRQARSPLMTYSSAHSSTCWPWRCSPGRCARAAAP